MPNFEQVQIDRISVALKSMFIADSLAMPVHWYYRTADILNVFPGGIKDFQNAPDHHPSSIMSLHSTQQGGRKSASKRKQREIVGDVILKGKAEFWNIPNIQYHHGMMAGDNTLNAHCVRVLIRSLIENDGHYDSDRFLDHYIDFMTADPPQHNDTYAESYHRGFFDNLSNGKPKNQCGAKTHDTASIGGLVTIAPLVFTQRLLGASLEKVQKLCQQHLQLTHPDDYLTKICSSYVKLLDNLLFRKDNDSAAEIINHASVSGIRLNLQELDSRVLSDHQVIGSIYSSACYIEHSWPGVLYLAFRYHDNLKQGLIANTNLGGDNVHRGIVLATLLGLLSGKTENAWFKQLIAQSEINAEINKLIELVLVNKR